MRLIDADALADALLNKRKNYPKYVADIIGNMPDAVVRCKDCKYCDEINDYGAYCEFVDWGIAHEQNWFCADGERKDI